MSFTKLRIASEPLTPALTHLAAAWCVVAALELFLDPLTPDSALRHAPLPPGTLLLLISHQLAVLGASVLVR